MKVDFFVEGKVKPKQSTRFRRMGNFIGTYTPSDVKEYANKVKDKFKEFIEVFPNFTPYEKAIELHLTVGFEVPKSLSKKKTEQCLAGYISPTVKPDCDNIVKQIADSLNGLAYLDDKQIVWLTVRKKYAEKPYVRIEINEFDSFTGV